MGPSPKPILVGRDADLALACVPFHARGFTLFQRARLCNLFNLSSLQIKPHSNDFQKDSLALYREIA